MSDQSIEQEIQAKGLTAPRVTSERIDALMARVVYSFDVRPNGSTSTLVHAFLDGKFYLASGHSACVSVENFDAEMGMKIAKRDVEDKARRELWKLEGYALRDRMERADRGDENQFADEQNAARLDLVVRIVGLLGLPNSATCGDVLNAVREVVRPSPHLSFGQALLALKRGEKVARTGWNGKGMWLSLSGSAADDGVRLVPAEHFWSQPNAEYARQNGGAARVLPCITMKTATGEILMGWLASQSDMLAEDWMIV